MRYKKKFIFLFCVCFSFDAFADFLDVSRVNENSAYKLTVITQEAYDNDTTGRVFKDYVKQEDGSIVPQYYRYDKNADKAYTQVIQKSASASGDGRDEFINVGLGLNNTGNIDGSSNVLYRNNQYEFDYNGDGASVYVRGGTVYNSGSILSQDADFVENSVITESTVPGAVYVQGGVLANKGDIGQITGDFVENSVSGSLVEGGAIYNENSGTIGQINGDFVGNHAEGESVKGGGIFNMKNIDGIEGDFIANSIVADLQANGGAIQNNDSRAVIGKINGNFVANKSATNSLQAWGGAIDNIKGTIQHISGNFSNNQALGDGSGTDAIGGAISNQGNIGSISDSNFLGNSANAGRFAYGGAIYNDSYLPSIQADFIGNSVSGGEEALGGAIYHDSDRAVLEIINSNFYDNKAESDKLAQGGAIYANNVNITADGGNSVFRGNTANGKSNAVYIDKGILGLSANNNGKVVFDDAIDGSAYNIVVSGDGTGEIVFNNNVDNVNRFTLNRNAQIHLGTSADINIKDYYLANDNILKLDIEVDRANNTIHNGIMHIDGDIVGNTNVIINSLNRDTLEYDRNAFGLFVEAPNDKVGNEKAFTVSRVVGSSYLWNTARNYQGETEGSHWYYFIDDQSKFAPELGAYAAMQTSALEQNRGISQKVGAGLRATCNNGCREKKFNNYRDAWIHADSSYAEINTPSDVEAKIKGVTAGFDLAADRYRHVGLFGAYRQGDYDLSGKGKFFSTSGSKMDIDSYLGGLYYTYGSSKLSVLATAFVGTQDIQMRTNDRIVSVDTDALQYGAGLEVGRRFYMSRDWIAEPSLGLYYTALDMDGFKDSLEREVDFDFTQYLEVELGLRLEHLFCMNGWTTKVYAKPSVIKTLVKGDKADIAEFANTKTVDDSILGRLEIGAKFGLSSSLSAYTSANYTYGDDYKAYGVDAGLTYSW